MNFFKHIILFLIFCFITNCNKMGEVNLFEELPLKSTDGKNTLGCKINGYSFVGNKTFSIRQLYYPGFSVKSEYNKNEMNFSKLEFFIDTLKVTKLKYNLEDVDFMVLGQIQGKPFSIYNRKFANQYSDLNYTGEVSFTRIDTLNGVYSGEFYLIKKPQSSSTMESILDGRFDTKDITKGK